MTAKTPAFRQGWVFAVLAAIPVAAAIIGLAATARATAGAWGLDAAVYWDAVHRWAGGGSYYLPWQLAGPYSIHGDGARLAVLMPPSFIPVAAAFALLPRESAWLWSIVPVIVIGWAVYRMRPTRWSWPILGLLVAWPTTGILVVTGNPTLALTAVLAVGLATGRQWLAAFVLLKPTLAPFALVGLRSRSWWLAVSGLVLLALPFGSMWLDWWMAIGNARDGGLLYSLSHVPTMSLPVVAWATSPARRCGSCRT